MLGIINNRRWIWAAMGKHPAAKDYIRIGGRSVLLDAVAAWSAKGYDALHPAKDQQPAMRSWRFWLRGAKKGTLICGLGRDSSDSIGRPHPLLIMGEGCLKGWEKRWPQLPTQLADSWKSMESIVARRFDDIHGLEEQIRNLTSPGVKFKADNAPPLTDRNDFLDNDLIACKQSIAQSGYAMFGLNNRQNTGPDPDHCAMQCHARLKVCCEKTPLGVFMGGPPQKSYMVVLQNPLRTPDFIRLWSL